MEVCRNLSRALLNETIPTICAAKGSSELNKEDLDMSYLQEELMLVDNIAKYIALVSIILSLIGNILVIVCHLRIKNLNSYKCLIVNLAVCDLFYTIMQIFHVHRRFNFHSWHFGRVMCKLMALSPGSLTCSMFTMCFMAIERCVTIVYPFRPRLKKMRAIMLIVLLWIVAICLHIPFMMKRDTIIRHDQTLCVYTWKHGDGNKKVNQLVSFTVTYPIPILIIAISSANIVYTAMKGIPKKVGEAHAGGGARINPLKKYRKLLCTFIAIFLVFIVTTTPNQALILWVNFAPTHRISVRSAKFTFFMLYMFAPLIHIHSWMNPLIYSFSDEKFRAVVLQIVGLFWRKNKRSQSGERLLRETQTQKRTTTTQRSQQRNSETKTSTKV